MFKSTPPFFIWEGGYSPSGPTGRSPPLYLRPLPVGVRGKAGSPDLKSAGGDVHSEDGTKN